MSSSLAWQPDGSLRIAGTTPLSAIAADPLVQARYAALAQACLHPDRAGVPDTITIADDLAQRGRCRYLQQDASCVKNGGRTCPAVDGDNRELSILDGGPSWLVHPSDAAVALVALDALLELCGSAGARTVAAAEFFVLPTERLDRETVLHDGERVDAVRLPAASGGGRQEFVGVRDASGMVLVSLAAARRTDGEVRLVLGSVSPRPYRVYNSIEEETTTGGLDEDTIEGLAERALLDAEPLSQNGFKVELAARLLRDAIRTLAAQ